MAMRSQVAVLRTTPETVIEDYGRLMRSIDYTRYLPKDRTTILKLNLSWSLYYPACSTAPWQLEGVLKTLREDGYEDIVAMEHRTVVTDPMKGLRNNLWDKVLRKYDVEFIPLTKVKWISYRPKAETPALDATFPDGHYIPECFIGANIIHLPTVKTHGHTTMTGAMKNAFGGLITERRHHCHKRIHEVLVELLKIQKEIHTGIFAVMDGTVCGDGKGPRTMNPVVKNVVLASADQVAIDAVAAKLMGFDPLSIPKLRMADELGLGNARLENIEVVGEDISHENWGFRVGKSPVIWGDQLFRKGVLSFIGPLLFHTRLFVLCVWASAWYHDYFWYPICGKRKIREFMKSDWGKLFAAYRGAEH